MDTKAPLPGIEDNFFGNSSDEAVEDNIIVSSKPAGTLEAILGNLALSGSIND